MTGATHRAATDRTVGRHGRALRIALVVGTLLTVVNHGSALLGLPHWLMVGLRSTFSYVVPFAVSLYATRPANR